MGKNDMLRMIQQLNFTMIELGLFLNNQPDCQNALALYERTRLMYIDARREETILVPGTTSLDLLRDV